MLEGNGCKSRLQHPSSDIRPYLALPDQPTLCTFSKRLQHTHKTMLPFAHTFAAVRIRPATTDVVATTRDCEAGHHG